MLERFYLIGQFYRPYFWVSTCFTFLLLLASPFFVLLGVKATLICLLYFLYNDPKRKQQLLFYNNFGISKVQLFGFTFLLDLFIGIVLLVLIRML